MKVARGHLGMAKDEVWRHTVGFLDNLLRDVRYAFANAGPQSLLFFFLVILCLTLGIAANALFLAGLKMACSAC